MELRPGTRLKSSVCTTEVVVITPPTDVAAVLRCGGSALSEASDASMADGQLDPALSGGSILGKRYVDDIAAVEVLCTRPGAGTLTVDDRVLQVKAAIALPTTD